MESHTQTLAKLQRRIDDYFISNHGNVPTNPKTWASVIQSSIARYEIESGQMSERLLNDILVYAVKKSLQSGAMARFSSLIEVDESDALDVDVNMVRRAIAFTKKYVRDRKTRRSFPKAPVKWLHVIKSEVHPNFPFTFPEYGLGPVANKVCSWYVDDCPYDASEELANAIPVALRELDAFVQPEPGERADGSLAGRKDDAVEDGGDGKGRMDGGQRGDEVQSPSKGDKENASLPPSLHKIDGIEYEKLQLIRSAYLHCLFCGHKITLIKNLFFVNSLRRSDRKEKFVAVKESNTKELTCDWFSELPVKSTKARCLSCNKTVGWPFVFRDSKLYLFDEKNVLYKMGSKEFILCVEDLAGLSKFVSEAFWIFLQSGKDSTFKQSWACIYCTSINKERRQLKCPVCNFNRLNEDEWACRFCTYFNKKEATNCEMCNYHREKKELLADEITNEKKKIEKNQNKIKNNKKIEKELKNDKSVAEKIQELEKSQRLNQFKEKVPPAEFSDFSFDREKAERDAFKIQTSSDSDSEYKKVRFFDERQRERPSSEKMPGCDSKRVFPDDFAVERKNLALKQRQAKEKNAVAEAAAPGLRVEKSPSTEKEDWRGKLKLGDRIDYRSSPQTLGRGHWVPCFVVQMKYEPSGLSLEVLFEGFPRVFEWVPLASKRIAPHKTHKDKYFVPEDLERKILPFTSYYNPDQSSELERKDLEEASGKDNSVQNGPMENKNDMARDQKQMEKGLQFGNRPLGEDNESERSKNDCKKFEAQKNEKSDCESVNKEEFEDKDLREFKGKIKASLQMDELLLKTDPLIIKEKSDTELENLAKSIINTYGGMNFICEQSSSHKAEFNFNIKEIYSNLTSESGNVEFKFTNNLPKMNRTGIAVPDEFQGTKSWGFISERAQRQSNRTKNRSENTQADTFDEKKQTVKLYLYTILVNPKTASEISPSHSFGMLVEHPIDNPPVLDVYLHTKEVDRENTNYDGLARFLPKGRIAFSYEQIDRLKAAHGYLYKFLCRGKLHPELYMDCTFSMFLVLPLDIKKNIDWICINRIYNVVYKEKMNMIDYLTLMATGSDGLIPRDELVLTLLYNTHEQHLYTFSRVLEDLDARSECDNENAQPGASWEKFLYSEFGITLQYPGTPLIETRQIHPRAQSVLIPPSVSKSHVPPLMNLVPELCEVHPLPLTLVVEMPDVVSIIWWLQNSLSVRKLQKLLPVYVSLPLLEEAMTFSVASSFKNYELLEFLGDSVLKYLATDYLFFKYKNTDFFKEGDLTEKRKHLIQNKTLLQYGQDKRIFDYSLICQFQRKDYLPPCFVKSINMKFKFTNPFVTDKQTADLVEAVLGATFLTNADAGAAREKRPNQEHGDIKEDVQSRFAAVAKVLQWFGSEVGMLPFEKSFCLKQQVPVADRKNPEMLRKVRLLEEVINYTFEHKDYATEILYQCGLKSNKKSKNYELLELLGDSVLDFLCTRKLFYTLPNTSPEDLTDARKELVCNDALAEAFEKFRMERFLYKMEANFSINLQIFYSREKDKLSSILPPESSVEKDQNRAIKRSIQKITVFKEEAYNKYPKKCGDFVESLIGAIYLDLEKDMFRTWKVIRCLTKLPKTEEALSLDCEFVGVGTEGHYNALARVSVVDFEYNTVYDKFVKPREKVIDWRTDISGIRREDVEDGEDLEFVQREVAAMIKGKILVGHNIESDLSVLFIKHPKYLIRDTALYRKFCPAGQVSLKNLCRKFLGIQIQSGEHSSVEDARETMKLYKEFMAREMKDIGDNFDDLKKLD